jgi:hypothetical protein
MAELSLLDTGLLADYGKSDYPEYDTELSRVTDTGQEFLAGVVYFYFPNLNLFFKSTLKKHAIARAIQHVLSPARIQEIIDDLESNGSIYYHINRLNIEQIRRKINRLYDNARITLEERDDLIAVLAHF